jgi:hypothetical protein
MDFQLPKAAIEKVVGKILSVSKPFVNCSIQDIGTWHKLLTLDKEGQKWIDLQ